MMPKPKSPLRPPPSRDALHRVPATLASLALLLAFASPGALAQEAEGRIVQELQITGLKTIPKSTVRSAIRITKGVPFAQKVADDDIKRLFALGKFSDIKVRTVAVEGGIKVIYDLAESPVIKQILFKGNDHVSKKALRKEMHLQIGQVLQPHLLKLDEERIEQLYRKKGYANVDVRGRSTKKGAVVVFDIQENPRVSVKKIVFIGRKSISKKTLLRQMQTRQRHFPSIIFRGLYDQDKIQSDVFAVQEYYRSQGWLDAVVAHEVRWDALKKNVVFVIRIEEGRRYTVKRIDIKGNTLFATREIRALLKLREGKPFLSQALRDDVASIREIYGEQGYVESKLKYDVITDPTAPQVTIRFRIDEGIRYYVEKIKISGMQRIQDRVIRRELTIFPGDRFDTSLVKDSQRRLRNTGFFDMASADSVAIDNEPGSEPNTKNLLLAVREGKVGDVTFGVGASSNTGIFGDIALTHRNFDIFDTPTSLKDFFTGNAFVGAGQILSLRLRPGRERQDYLLSFQNPSVFDSPYSFGTSAYYRKRYWEDWDERRIGGTLSTGRRLTRDLMSGLTLRYDYITIYNLDPGSPADAFAAEGSHNRVGLELSLRYDKRDSRFLPSKGHMVDASIEGTTTGVKVVRFQTSATKYFTVWNFRGWGKHILSTRGSFGVVWGYSGKTPIFERFWAGGSGSLRGFDYRGVGPVDKNTRDAIGGEYMLLAGAEYSVPIYRRYARAHTFLDTGTVEMQLSDLVSEIRAAWGVGMELRFPMFNWMPIVFDFGFPLIQQKDDQTRMFTFTIGSGFSF